MRSTVFSRIPPRGTLIVAAALLAVVNCEQVDVTAVNPARVDLQPQTTSIAVAETTRLNATVLSSDGKTLPGRSVEWTSLAPTIATVDNTGMVRGMAPGQATIRATSGAAAGSATVNVTAAPSIGVAPAEVTFSAILAGATPGDRTVIISNAGTGTLAGLSATVRYASGEPTGWLTSALASTSAPTTLVLTANQQNLAVGTYTATVDVSSSTPGVTTRSVTARLTVLTPAPAIGLGANNVVFSAVASGADPAQQTVGLTNAGGGSLTGLAAAIEYTPGQRTGWLTATLSSTTAPATLTLRAATAGVPAGTYTASVRITSAVAQNSPQTVAVTFTVTAQTTSIALNQQNITFSAPRGGSSPPTQVVQVTSLTATQIGGLTVSVTYGQGQPTDWATATLSGTTTPATVTIGTTTGALPTGIYAAQVTVASPNASNSPQTVNVAFNVVDPLGAPTALTATPVSSTQIDLAWTAPAGTVTRYRIERKTGAAGTYAVIDSVTTTSYQNVGLSAATQYYYRVVACNALSCSPPSAEATATTGPSAPSSLTASATSASQIDLAWAASTGTVTRYRIERKTGAAGTYAVIDSVSNGTTTYANGGLAAATQYFYRVQACNGGVCSPYSNEANATTGQLAPGAPASLTATAAGATQVNLAWAAASGTVTRYRIERKIGAGGTYAAIDSVANGVLSYSNTGLTPATQYFYRVQACNSAGCSPYSPEANATTAQVPPGTPAGITATTISSTEVRVTWGASSGTVDYYKVERKTGAAGTYAVADSVGSGTLTSLSTGLTPSTTYFFRVSGCNGAGCSTPTAEVSATTYPPPPGAPTNLTAQSISSSQINISWTAATGTVARYYIERKTGAGGTYAVIDSVTSGVTAYQNTGLTPATEYFYQVRACNAGGCSPYSNSASATTALVPPNPPTSLTATTVSSAQINLAWSGASGTITSYLIERKPAGGAYAVINNVAGNVTAYSDNTGLNPAAQYYYQVRACNAAGCSVQASPEANATTFPLPPSTPTGLTATPASATQVDLSWTASATGPVTTYRVERQDPGGSFVEIASISGTTYSNTSGLTGGTQYAYQVRACNAGGCSPYTSPVTALTFPNTPTNLTANPVSSTQIDLSWTASGGLVSAYKIERKDGANPFVEIASVPGTTYQDMGLTASTQYSYQLRACNASGCSGYTPVISPTTLPTPPGVPAALTATAVSAGQIDLSWTAPTTGGAVAFYRVEQQTSGGAFSEIASSVTGTTYSSTGLTGGTQYGYQVRACNSGGCSAYSPVAFAMTLPNPPSNLNATPVSSSRIDLTWVASTSSVTLYQIERRDGSGGVFAPLANVAAGTTSYSDLTVVADSQYGYRVRACISGTCSTYSNTANAKTPVLAIPGTPGTLTATAVSSSEIDLAWGAASGSVATYEIQRASSGGSFSALQTVSGSTLTFQNTALPDSTAYDYRVRACNAAGCSGYSNVATALTPLAVPGVPANVNAASAGLLTQQINVSWATATGHVDHYDIEQQPQSGSATVFTVPYNVLMYQDKNLTIGVSYTYRVRACNSAGACSAYSASTAQVIAQ